ncbi:Fatty-acyl-CoA synthase system [Ascochyta lentis]
MHVTPECVLIDAAKRREILLLAVFGGQGPHNGKVLGDLRQLINEYPGFAQRLVKDATRLLNRLTQDQRYHEQQYEFGFDLDSWLRHPERSPGQAYLATAPVSFPLNGLFSLVRYCIFCCTFGLHPGQMTELLRGTTGHSQGIVVAAAIASARNWDSFFEVAQHALEILFWVGLKSHLASPGYLLRGIDTLEGGAISPMLSVKGLDREQLEELLEEVNSYVPSSSSAFIGLVNSAQNFTISGPPKTLKGVRALLEKRRAPDSLDQSRVPYHRRLPEISYQFLPISAAFHSPYLRDSIQDVISNIKPGILTRDSLGTSLYHTCTGNDMRDGSQQELTPVLVEMIMSDPVEWPKTLSQREETHILDFGPGNTSGLMHAQLAGSGVRLLPVFEQDRIAIAFTAKNNADAWAHAPIWSALYRPRIEKQPNGTVELRTHMSDLLGMPPVMVAGMTPTSASPELVAAVLNAGYHIELAGGAYSRAQDFEAAIRQVARSISDEQGITCNLIYANPKAMAWQIPLIRRLVAEGVNIAGLTIGAGVPSPEIANEYIETLRLKHISFKPSSVNAIHQVLAIASANPSFPIGLQWTSGMAGGHHSGEDFCEPIIKTYASIRAQSNVILIAGGGYGRAAEVLPYLTGDWSRSFGYACMPFDGVLLGSRLMTAREARTSREVKQIIASTVGTLPESWHQSYDSGAGGVVSVYSEMGERIWKIATRAVMLWKELDETLFSIKDKPKRLARLHTQRTKIVDRLNADFAKPWFAVDTSGQAGELEDMTYVSVVNRLVQLMYLDRYGRWVHESYSSMVLDFIARIGKRFGSIGVDPMTDPMSWAAKCEEQSAEAASQLLHPSDVLYFLDLCRRTGQKPVNFIPRLDEHFETWFKKDSLWQMENLEAVIDQDPQRVCIIHGPVAAQYSIDIDEPAGEILGGILEELTRMLLDTHSVNTSLPVEKSLIDRFQDYEHIATPGKSTISLNLDEYDSSVLELVQRICGEVPTGISACLKAPKVFRDGSMVDNPILASLRPVAGTKMTMSFDLTLSRLDALTLSTPTQDGSEHTVFRLESSRDEDVALTLCAPIIDKSLPSKLKFTFQVTRKGNEGFIRETTSDRDEKIRAFLAKQWALQPDSILSPPGNTGFQAKFTLLDWHVREFLALISRAQTNNSTQPCVSDAVPMDIGVFVAWPALVRPLMASEIGGDLLRLLHRSNSFEYVEGTSPLRIGDEVEINSQVTAVTVSSSGKLVEVSAVILRSSLPVLKVTSSFLIQGRFPAQDKSFRLYEEPELKIAIETLPLVAVLKSRSWITWTTETNDLLHKRMVVRLSSYMELDQDTNLFALRVTGDITEDSPGKHCLANIDFQCSSCSTNPVLDFFKQHSTSESGSIGLEQPGSLVDTTWRVRVPESSLIYSRLSGDRNPIHTSSVFAGLAGLPGPIVHGMWTSAVVRNVIEQRLVDGNGDRFRRWATSFEGMVQGNDVLRIEVQHTAMNCGRMILKIRAYNDQSGSKVLDAEAEVEQPPTAYLFCGQGSQQKGMGMELYHTNLAAQKVWDRSEKYLFDLYGFSLLDVVRNDPKELVISFTGSRGRKLRANYLALTRNVVRDGQELSVGVIEEITPFSTSYTFRDDRGLLSSTQFAQPALTIMELAEMEALRSRGVVQQGAEFAGHSLGEYAALAACTSIMSLEGMLSLVFYRGLVMQRALKRNETGQTDFAMVAVNPSRIGSGFQQESLEVLVAIIASVTGLLLETVNYNVTQQQYVCAGHLQAHQVLQRVCDELHHHPHPETVNNEDLAALVRQHFSIVKESASPIRLERGTVTIPLQGIDVPFHSSYLHDGIDAYRRFLLGKIRQSDVHPHELIGKFIPNVVGKPFATSKEYVRDVVEITKSESMRRLLATME